MIQVGYVWVNGLLNWCWTISAAHQSEFLWGLNLWHKKSKVEWKKCICIIKNSNTNASNNQDCIAFFHPALTRNFVSS